MVARDGGGGRVDYKAQPKEIGGSEAVLVSWRRSWLSSYLILELDTEEWILLYVSVLIVKVKTNHKCCSGFPSTFLRFRLAADGRSLLVLVTVVFDSLRPPGLQPARLLCLWNSPGKNTGVGCQVFSAGDKFIHRKEIVFAFQSGQTKRKKREACEFQVSMVNALLVVWALKLSVFICMVFHK